MKTGNGPWQDAQLEIVTPILRRFQEVLVRLASGFEPQKSLLRDMSYENSHIWREDSKQYAELRGLGLHQDVATMEQLLMEVYGYRDKDIQSIIHREAYSGSQPTLEKLLRDLSSVIKNVHLVDPLLSCHSGSPTEAANDHESGAEASINETDITPNDELGRRLVESLLVGNNLIAILDSCHPTQIFGNGPSKSFSNSSPFLNSEELSARPVISRPPLPLRMNSAISAVPTILDIDSQSPLIDIQEGFNDVPLRVGELCGTSQIVSPPLHVQGVTLLHPVPVSCGGYADLYQASYNGDAVALKRLRVFQKDQERRKTHQKIINEALLWQPLIHPYLVPFLGIETETASPFICLVTPWMEFGTVMDVISKQGRSESNANKYLLEVSQGLAYLHSAGVVHGNICGRNVLVNKKGHACLADFGMHTITDTALAAHGPDHHISPRWMAPELLDPEAFGFNFQRTYASDVYAFACLCVEVYTERPPFWDIICDFAVMSRVLQGVRPVRPSEENGTMIPDGMWLLIEKCWTQTPVDRLEIGAVVEVLEGQRT